MTGFTYVWSAAKQLGSFVPEVWLLAEAGGPGVFHYPASYPWLVPVVRLAKFQELEQTLANIFEA